MSSAHYSLLVVDDYAQNRNMLSQWLGRLGYRVSVAEHGIQALEAIKNNPFDLVLLDVMMPGIDGLEVLKKIRETYSVSDLPVIMVTAKTGVGDVAGAIKSGANDYITKPMNFPVALARIQMHLKLKRLTKLKDEFLSMASHDLKKPLAVILDVTKSIKEELSSGTLDDSELDSTLSLITKSGEYMQKIVEDFLVTQEIEEDQLKLARTPINLNKIAEYVVETNIAYAGQKQIALTQKLDKNLPLVSADNIRIEQVMQNLVGNAIKFSPAGSKTMVRTITMKGEVKVEVSDTGPGLSDEDLEKAFSQYAKLSNAPTGGESSSGLGLSICKRIVDLHQGNIGVQTKNEGGATFWFTLPVNPE